MATIKLKLPVYAEKSGFDFCNRPTTNAQARGFVMTESSGIGRRNDGCIYVYHMQKFNKRTVRESQYTPTGRVKKDPKITITPTHWVVKVYSIPKDVVTLLKLNGKKIVQRKHHWEIV
jgi:hypothetical protein